MAGGKGERFWPLSTSARPKQVLSLIGGRPMLAQAVERLSGFIPPERILIITSASLVDVSRRAVPELPPENVIGEPCGRDTAAACALGAAVVKARCADGAFCILTADHVIKNVERFQRILQRGFEQAEQAETLVTIGIKPLFPSTGFGYIECGDILADGDVRFFKAQRFVEKPDAQTAAGYLESGTYVWNSGMFIWKADTLLNALQQFEKPVYNMASAMLAVVDTAAFEAALVREYNCLGRISIDYAVMEKTARSVVIPIDCGWSDVGSWSALLELGEQDGDGNILQGNVLAHDVQNCYVNASHRMVAAVGVKDHIIVETADAVLVISTDKAQDVKKIVELLKAKGQTEAILHRRVFRPWGSYEGIDNADRYQVKRIVVKPGATLSLQMHYHRAEHWIVVKGTAKVTNGSKTILLCENQSTYIPLGEQHRLENPGVIPLELIEVQSGSYLGEDDIVRFEDNYGRVQN
ncbi:MAG TPA: mannose-1-phosphate guanylyltransferase/mannose-6-phosphate isomerase [Verrucomicrobia bacterium]|nr:mannose-1-phosphate guanylyltransferase/mannose-6-phosphate isomerase [Verrucomicrobiota bacterium]